MEELWAENKNLKNELQTLETALKTTTDALKAVPITITNDRADFQKKLNDLELSFEKSLYSDAENDNNSSCQPAQRFPPVEAEVAEARKEVEDEK